MIYYLVAPNFKVRVRIPESQQSGVLAIFPSYEGDFTEVGYTITVYSSGMTIIWDEQLPPPPFTTKVSMNALGLTHVPYILFHRLIVYLLARTPVEIVAIRRSC